MSAIGAKYLWENGKILHAARLWKPPTMRRIPRILIERRALDVGIKMSLRLPWMVFEETEQKSSEISRKDAIQLEFYFNRFHLIPRGIDGVDTYEWLRDSSHALIVWGDDGKYYAKPIRNR